MDIVNKKIYESRQLWDNYGTNSPAETERINFVLNNLPDDASSVVDIGCGSGSILNCIQAKFLVGLDCSCRALDHVRPHKVQGHVAILPFMDSSFDLVMSCEVLEHLPKNDIKITVNEMLRVSRKYVLVTVPYKENLSLRTTRCLQCYNKFHQDGHFQKFDSHNLATLFKDTKIIKQETFGPVRQRYREWIVSGFQKLGFCFADPTMDITVCPECGNKNFKPLRTYQKRIRRYTRKLARNFERNQPNWMLLLAEK